MINSVVQRQAYLMSTGLAEQSAYDIARKEFYRFRHHQEIETRVAREEALATGGFFGPGPVEIGMKLEDKAYDDWHAWAEQEIIAQKQQSSSAYTGTEAENAESSADTLGPNGEDLEMVADSIPGSKAGQAALGGAPIRS